MKMLCKRKIEKQEAFRVGRHQLPDWVLDKLKDRNSGVTISVTAGILKTNIVIRKGNFKAESGEWIVNDDGVWVKYTNSEFRKTFEVVNNED